MTAGIEPAIELLQSPALTTWLRHPTRHGMEAHGCPLREGAEDGGRTRDLLLGKETRYHCATSAGGACDATHSMIATPDRRRKPYSPSGTVHITPIPGTVFSSTGFAGSSSTLRRNR